MKRKKHSEIFRIKEIFNWKAKVKFYSKTGTVQEIAQPDERPFAEKRLAKPWQFLHLHPRLATVVPERETKRWRPSEFKYS